MTRLTEMNRTILAGQCLQQGGLTLEFPEAASVAVHPRCLVARNLTQLNWHLAATFVQEHQSSQTAILDLSQEYPAQHVE